MYLLTTPSSRDLYAILGLAETATSEEIHARFCHISKTHHPDITGGVESDLYAKCRHAHDILMDPVQRQVYDTTGEDPDSQYSKALSTIHRHTVTILEKGWIEANFLKQLTKSIQEEITKIDKGIVEGEKLVAGAKKLKTSMGKRWSGAVKVSHVIITGCTQTIEKHEEGLRRIKEHKATLALTLTLLGQVKYEWQEYNPPNTQDVNQMMAELIISGLRPPNIGRW